MSDTRAALAAVAAEVAKLRGAYMDKLPAELDQLRQLADDLDGSDNDRIALEQLHHRLHKLAGSGGTFGLSSLSAHARNLEQTVKAWLDREVIQIGASSRLGFAAGVAALPVTLEEIDAPLRVEEIPPMHAVDDRVKRIWIVDDDELLGKDLKLMLDQFGYDVRLFARFGDAEMAIRSDKPDALIMDVMFPAEGLNATEVLGRSAVFQGLSCPLLFMSSSSDFDSRVRAARLKASGFLVKPLDVSQLVDKLEQLFSNRQRQPFRILIVDDDETLSTHFRLALMSAGMAVEVLNDPSQVINCISAFRPELVLMDVNMPNYQGPELASVIRYHEEWIGLPIVYLSAETDVDRQIEALGRGADDFLTKPISDSRLIAAVKVRVERARQLANLMYRDSLTSLLTHARIKEELMSELMRARRDGRPLSVVMLDIDHFKSVNDTYGHPMGDRIIKAVAHLLRQRLRRSDAIGRYGGEEFLAVLPDCDESVAQSIMNDIRLRFSALRFHHGGAEFACSLSAGLVAWRPDANLSASELMVAADEALYAAKRQGRNRVCVAGQASCKE